MIPSKTDCDNVANSALVQAQENNLFKKAWYGL